MLHRLGVEAYVRALNFLGLIGLTVLVGCGGTSSGGRPETELEGGSGGKVPSTPLDGGAGAETGGAREPGGKGGSGGVPSMTGGASMMPAGGRSPLPSGGSPSVPEGCMPSSQSAAIGFCQLSLMCENTTINSTCKDRGDGRLECYCDNGMNSAGSYTIEGVSGLAACSAIAEICAAGGEPVFAGPEECRSQAGNRSAAQCDLQALCTRPLAANEAVSVTVSSSYISCQDNGSGKLTCRCDKGQQYQLEGADGNTGCDIVQDLCGDEVEYTGEPVCMPSGQSVGPGYCQTQLECTQKAEVDGVVAVRSDYRQANCQSMNGGVSMCSCLGSDGSGIQFDFEGAVTLATCDTAASLCNDVVALELTGTMQCESASQSVQQNNCQSSLDCVQGATVGDLTVKVHGSLQTTCTATASGLSCTCASGTNKASATFPSTGDLWTDCSEAAQKCRDVVEVQVGSSGTDPMRPTPPPFK